MIKRTLIRYPIIQKNHGGSYSSFLKKLPPVGIEEAIQHVSNKRNAGLHESRQIDISGIQATVCGQYR